MIYLIPLLCSTLAALFKLPTRALWLLVGLCLLYTPLNVQEWGIYHYYMGAKYFQELGYFQLYECTAAAYGKSFTRRNLNTYDFRFDLPTCEARFTPERWREFRKDLARVEFEPRMLRDKGDNATPAWITLGLPLTRLPLDWLMWIDPLLVGAAIAAAALLVSPRQAAYTALFILTYYGAFNRLWGHWGQWLWLALVIVGVSLLVRKRAWGGMLVGLAGALMVFPLFVLLGHSWRVMLWGVLGLMVGLCVGLFNPRGGAGYLEFAENIRIHSAYIRHEPNNVGLANSLVMLQNPEEATRYMDCFRDGRCSSTYQFRENPLYWIVTIPLMVASPIGLMFALQTLSRYYLLILAIIPLERGEVWVRGLLALNAVLFGWMLIDRMSLYIWGQLLWVVYFGAFWVPLLKPRLQHIRWGYPTERISA